MSRSKLLSIVAFFIVVALILVLIQEKKPGSDRNFHSQLETSDFDADAIIADIEALPPWGVDGLSSDDLEHYGKVADQIRGLQQERLAEAYRSYSRKHIDSLHPDQDSLGKLFILSRVLFDPPAHVPIGQAKRFDGYIDKTGKRVSTDRYDAMWPLKDNHSGVRVACGYHGSFGTYDAMGELAYFTKLTKGKKRSLKE